MANEVRPFYINGHKYEGYSDCWFHYEMVMSEEPERSTGNGAMTNINDIPRYRVPRLWIDFMYMPIEKYRQFMADTYPVEMVIGAVDPVSDQMVYHKMYLAPQQRNKLRYYGGEYTGILNMSIEFIGTNNSLDYVNIVYNPNGGEGSIAGQSIVAGQEYNLLSASGLYKSGYAFDYWCENQDGSGARYNENQVAVATKTTTYYAIWKENSKRVLSFSYGNARTALNSQNEPIYNKDVTMNQAVGELPPIELNSVSYDGQTYTEPYDIKGWYGTPDGGGTKWTEDTIYTIQGNGTIYAVTEAQDRTITFDSNGGNYTPTPLTQPYKSYVYLPYAPTQENKTFVGWFKDNGEQFVSGTMPPIDITLTAKWE